MPAKLRRRRKLWILIGLTALAFVGLAWFFLVDEAPSDDSDLRAPRVKAPDAENGYLLVKLSKNDVFWPEEDPEEEGDGVEASDPAVGEPDEKPSRWEQLDGMTSGEKWYPELAAEILRRNAEVLRRLDEALERPAFQCDEVASFIDYDQQGILDAWKRLADAHQLRAWALFRDGKEKEAVVQALKLTRFGFRVQATSASLLHLLRGGAMKWCGVTLLRRLVRKSSMSVVQLPEIASVLDGLQTRKLMLVETFSAQYRAQSNEIEACARGEGALAKLGGPGIFKRLARCVLVKPHLTCRQMAELARALIAGSIVLDHPEGHLDVRVGEVSRSRWWNLLRNWAGEISVDFGYHNSEEWVKVMLDSNALLVLTQAFLAVTVFQAQTGALPETLEELVPSFLDRVPVDPFGGKPLRYSRQKGLIYSIGRDYVDAGGSAEDDENEAANDPDEPTLRLEK